MRKLLLISSSRVHGKDFLEHAAKDLRKHFNGKSVLFVPYALAEHESTTDTVRRHFKEFGLDLVGMHEAADPRQAILEAEGIYVGGGNTFRLLATLQELGLLAVIARRVRAGMPYAGASAGSNLACPTLMTTNDMPIVEPRSFEALGLVRFQLNPHYIDADPTSTHMGETRIDRIEQFHEVKRVPVIGLREGAWLTIENDRVTVGGEGGGVLFLRDEKPREVSTGDRLEADLEPARK